MFRTGAILIGACIAIIAASASVMLYVHAGFSPGEAVTAGLIATLVMTVLHVNAGSGRERARTRAEIDRLRQANEALQRDVQHVRSQLTGLQALTGSLEEMGKMIEARAVVTMEQRVEEQIVKQVARARELLLTEVQPLEQKIDQISQEMGAARRSAPASAEDAATAPAAASRRDGTAAGHADTPLGHLDDDTVLGMVRKAIENNRSEIYFQPIVTLPQRKLRYYEAFTRLRGEEGELILPADFLRVAEPAGIMPLIDNLLLFRTVQVVRRLIDRNRLVGVFCNISNHSLVDPDFFPQFMDFLENNKLLASSIFFEFSQAMIEEAGPIEVESLAALHEQGFRFSMDQVYSLGFNPQQLAQRGFKFVKIEAGRLLDDGGSGAQIHPADLPKLLARYGIELIAEKIEQEGTLLNILDFEVRLAQGNLFGEPRPARGNFGENLPELAQARKAS